MMIPGDETLSTTYGRPLRPKWANGSATTMGDEVAESQGTRSTFEGDDFAQRSPSQSLSRTVVLAAVSVLGLQLVQGPSRSPNGVFFEASIDQVGFPDSHTTTTTPQHLLWQDAAPDTDPIRGTFVPTIERKVLFTLDLDSDAPQLRRWNPEVALHPIDFEPEDE